MPLANDWFKPDDIRATLFAIIDDCKRAEGKEHLKWLQSKTPDKFLKLLLDEMSFLLPISKNEMAYWKMVAIWHQDELYGRLREGWDSE